MKIAMIRCFDELKKSGNMRELPTSTMNFWLEASEKDKLRAIEILKESMENAVLN